MPDIWQQFHRLPRPIRDAVATPSALATIDRLEQQYPDLDTAGLVMRVMVKEVPIDRIVDTVANEGKVDGATAEQVVTTLRQDVFQAVGDYLGLRPAAPPAATLPRPNLPPAQRPPGPVVPISQPPAARPAAIPPPMSTFPKPAPIRPPIPPVVAVPAAPVGATAPTQAYSDDEAKEIAEQAQKIQRLASPSSGQDFDDIAKQLLDQHQLAFSDELLSKRALAILKARLKDIRQSDETLAMLTRDPKVGGLGLDSDLAANLVTTLETRAKDLKSRGMVTPRVIPPPLAPPPVPSVMQTRPEPKPPLRTLGAPENLPVAAPPGPPPSVTEPPRPSRPIQRPADLPQPPPVAVAPAPIIRPTPPTLQRSRVMERPKVADVTRPSRTYGPAEEMRSLTLAEFRRLGQGAGESTRKLLDKFHHLQQESFTLWADAISGWRQSDIYRLYLEMGRESLEQNIAITAIIQRRASQNQPYLSEHEFTAVADLNRQLQY